MVYRSSGCFIAQFPEHFIISSKRYLSSKQESCVFSCRMRICRLGSLESLFHITFLLFFYQGFIIDALAGGGPPSQFY